MHRLYLVWQSALLTIILLVPLSNAVSSPLQLGNNSSYDLSGYMSVFEDPSRRMKIQDVLATNVREEFTPLHDPFNAGYSRSAFWFRFTLERGKGFPGKGWLRFSPSYLDEVTIYIPLPAKDPMRGSSYRAISLGMMVPAEKMPVRHPEFVAPIDLDIDKPVTVYVRVFSNSSINLTGYLHTDKDLMEYTSQYVFRQSAYLGIALMIALMNLMLYAAVRSTQFFYFSLYVFTSLITFLTIKGMHILLFPSLPPIVPNMVSGMVSGGGLIVFALFALSLFKDMGFPLSSLYLKLMIPVGLLSMLAVPFGMYAMIMPWVMKLSFVLIAVIIWMSFRGFVQEPRYWITYLLAFSLNGLSYIVLFLQNLGVLSTQFSGINTFQLSSLVNILLIFLAMTARLRRGELRVLENTRLSEQRAIEMAQVMTQELKENKERLEVSLVAEHQSSARLQRFLVMLSHEYRTPLAVIQGNIDLLERQILKYCTDCQDEFLKMRRAIGRLVEVMEVSLDQSRITEPKVRGEQQCFSIDRFVAQQINTVRLMWPEKTFQFEDFTDERLLQGDLPLLNTALFNLLDNARKYSPLSAPVVVSCKIKEHTAEVIITNATDSPVPDDSETLFEKYRRGANALGVGGAGIGLWLVREIASQYGGSIQLRYRNEGIVTATLMLPLFSDSSKCKKL